MPSLEKRVGSYENFRNIGGGGGGGGDALDLLAGIAEEALDTTISPPDPNLLSAAAAAAAAAVPPPPPAAPPSNFFTAPPPPAAVPEPTAGITTTTTTTAPLSIISQKYLRNEGSQLSGAQLLLQCSHSNHDLGRHLSEFALQQLDVAEIEFEIKGDKVEVAVRLLEVGRVDLLSKILLSLQKI